MPDVQPEWLKIAAPNARLTYRDVCNLLGISVDTLNRRIKNGQFPAADYKVKGFNAAKSRYWHVSTVRKFVFGEFA